MNFKLAGTLAVGLTLGMVGYMSFSLKSASAQDVGKPALSPEGSGSTVLDNMEDQAAEPLPEDVGGGCCGRVESPCAEAMLEKPCKGLGMAERARCIEEQLVECKSKFAGGSGE